jgi:hypothetical protein
MFNSYGTSHPRVNDSVMGRPYAVPCGGLARMTGHEAANRWTGPRRTRHLAVEAAPPTSSCGLKNIPVLIEKQGKIR